MLLPYGLENDHVRNEDSKPGNRKNPAEMQEVDMDRTFTEEMQRQHHKKSSAMNSQRG